MPGLVDSCAIGGALRNVLGEIEEYAPVEVEGKVEDEVEECALELLLGLELRWLRARLRMR